MQSWQNIYTTFDPVAFSIGSVSVHWYGMMYALSLISAIVFAHWLIKKDKLPISKDQLDSYIIWVEVGVILGARLGYILFYDPNTTYYLTHPWQIFNPFSADGSFVGISGMSYHGALIGFVIASILWARKNSISFWFMADIAAISVPLGYIFGRIGNFLNKELVGRTTEQPWGIYVDGVLRHPSALYEAVLEGLVVFLILFAIRTKKRFNGQIAMLYVMLYSIARSAAEIFREPDIQLGFLLDTNWLTMGMLISFVYTIFVMFVYVFLYKKSSQKIN